MILGSAKIFLFRIYQIGAGTLIAALLARVLGPNAYGDYVFILTIVSVVVIPVQFGMSTLIIRETARPTYKEGFHRWALRQVLVWTIFGAAILMIFLLALDTLTVRDIKDLALVSTVTAICISAMYFLAAIMAGQKRTEKEQFYQNVLRPTGFLIVLVVLLVLLGWDEITVQLTLSAHLISVLLVVVMLATSLRGKICLHHTAVPREVRTQWLWSTTFFIAMGGTDALLQTADILMLGTISDSEDVAVYRIGALLAGLLSLPLSAASTHATPRIAAADGPEETAGMQGRCIQLARVSFAVTVVFLIAAIGLGRPVIELVFGTDYGDSFEIMLILCLASVFNVMMGLNRLVLTLKGYEGVVFRVLAWSSVLNVGLNAVLVAQYGAIGAAVATTVSVIVWNVWLHFECYRLLGYRVAIFSRPYTASGQLDLHKK